MDVFSLQSPSEPSTLVSRTLTTLEKICSVSGHPRAAPSPFDEVE